MPIPQLLLRRLYTLGSLANERDGFSFEIKNRLTDVTLLGLRRLRVDGADVALGDVEMRVRDDRALRACDVTPESPAPFALRDVARVQVRGVALPEGDHEIRLTIETFPFGTLEVTARDSLLASTPATAAVGIAGPFASAGSTVSAATGGWAGGAGATAATGEWERSAQWSFEARWGTPAAQPARATETERDAGEAAASCIVKAPMDTQARIPYDSDPAISNSADLIAARQAFASERTGASLRHVAHFSLDPQELAGNTENFIGVAQVPIGIAGPLRVNGEHAVGDFLIPLATTEGTLVASYNRGIKVLNLAGGATCTVLDDCMQRAPVFVFADAREARAFRDWVALQLPAIREAAEATSRHAKLVQIETYLAAKLAYLRFGFTTGDAAGQNMVGRATLAACEWILAHARGVRRFYLESNLATDKKASQVNTMRTRGKRVTAEATVPAAVLRRVLRVEPEQLAYHAGVANVGAMLAGTNNNGLHSANGITAMFIATGQDVANVAEGSAALVYGEVTRAGDLYISITIPSLIVATHGGGTGLPTQRECLEMLGCTGRGTVNKLAEIIAGVVLAGELSLAGAISSLEWVSAHEQYGRNR